MYLVAAAMVEGRSPRHAVLVEPAPVRGETEQLRSKPLVSGNDVVHGRDKIE
jgi:hypothetical protein